ncbi:MAG: ATP synthase F1 subunit delta [Actinomycetota bacterium]|nr:ATP synthase F1 subunit delta [Actinomycetota bacterium]
MEEIASVYARSLFEVARDSGQLETVHQQLGQFADTLEADQQLQVFFFSPYFSTPEKKDGLRRAVTDADPVVLNFLELLIEKHRMPAIFRIRRAFDKQWEDVNRLLPVQVTSAIALDEATVQQIGERIAQQTGRRVNLQARVEPDILGGIVVRVGNSVLDASVSHRLELLRRQLTRAG